MYTDIQLEAIKLFGRKDLSFGCIVKMESIFEYRKVVRGEMKGTFQVEYSGDIDVREGDYEILGHIPHLEDLFRVAEEKGFGVICYKDGLEIYIGQGEDENMQSIDYNPTLSLLDQPSLQDIISLFK